MRNYPLIQTQIPLLISCSPQNTNPNPSASSRRGRGPRTRREPAIEDTRKITTARRCYGSSRNGPQAQTTNILLLLPLYSILHSPPLFLNKKEELLVPVSAGGFLLCWKVVQHHCCIFKSPNNSGPVPPRRGYLHDTFKSHVLVNDTEHYVPAVYEYSDLRGCRCRRYHSSVCLR